MKSIPDSSPIWQNWLNGGAVTASNAIVTVEPGYQLNVEPTPGTFLWPPARWWQRADNSQTEVVVPNVVKIEHQKSTDADAHTATITIRNFRQPSYGEGSANGDFGQPGYLTPTRGERSNRWGYATNEWYGILGVNALLRTYEGYGGQGMSLSDALAAGNLVLTGTWLVDDPNVSTDGTLTLKCRNIGKLLVDQQVFPPLVPPNIYPVSFTTEVIEDPTPAIVYGHLTGDPPWLSGSGKYIIGIELLSDAKGYLMVGSDGGVFNYGDSHFFGCPVGVLGAGDWAVGVAHTPTNNGYWIVANGGGVYAYGDAVYHGNATSSVGCVTIEAMGSNGYIIVDNLGEVYALGPTAEYHGGSPTLTGGAWIVDAAVHPDGHGYWMCDNAGHVFAYGSASYHGGLASPPSGGPIVGMDCNYNGNGYYLTGTDGGVFCFGSGTDYFGGEAGTILADPVVGIMADHRADNGYYLVAADGGVFTFSRTIRTQLGVNVPALNFYGSLPGTFTYTHVGNYEDFTRIIKFFLLWSGYYLYDGGATGQVFGQLESTGTHSTDILDASLFDKKPVADAIKYIADIVGYLHYTGDWGEFHFHEPNWWESGNWLPDFSRTASVPIIDERVQLTAYQRSSPDSDIRSEIIISSEDPYPDGGGGAPPGTVTTSYTPDLSRFLKGMIRPAMWINEGFAGTLDAPDPQAAAEQNTIAQLIALRIYFQSQLGSVEMLANPMIEVGDQVQILERQAFETNYHYVKSIQTSHDLLTGEYTQSLTTHVLSPQGEWAVTKPSGAASGTVESIMPGVPV